LVDDISGYPPEVKEILVKKCATSGCHNEISKETAGGISFETWNSMFEGGNSGAVTIPYRPDFSVTMFFVNTDSTRGISLLPTMPYNSAPLTDSEYSVLKNWIAKGAPDKNGFVKFSEYPGGQKLYIANRVADVITVLDVTSNLAIRYIDAGITDSTEFPHMVRCSPDGKYWYVIFFANGILQKFNTADNSLAGNILIGSGSWNSITISSDSKKAFVTEVSGKIATVNLETMSLGQVWTGFLSPQGSALNENNDTLYVTSQSGNFIYKIPVNNPIGFDTISIEAGAVPNSTPSLDPNQIIFSNDFSKYYVSCQRSNEVRVVQTSNDSLLSVIQTSKFPTEMKLSSSYPYLFVSCMSEPNAGNSILGRIDVINTNANAVIKSIMSGHQPHGLAVSDAYKRVYVANRNISHGGPSPHHNSPFGRNGYLTAIDLSTLELIPGFKSEVSVDPYSMDLSH
jgi:DNA-binding beta-propeller fold protein YncE